MVATKNHQLNRFLSKTYHMINNCDRNIASWAPSGDSFLIKDIEKFTARILPKYFKHSKFSSFVRQLNFYGFRKLRPESAVLAEDESSLSNLVRFYHEHFQPGQPELLHKITRATKTSDRPSSPEPERSHELEELQAEMAALKSRLNVMGDEMEQKLVNMKAAMEFDYQRRIAHMESNCQKMITSLLFDQYPKSSRDDRFGSSSPLSVPAAPLSAANGGINENLLRQLPMSTLASMLSNGFR